MDHIDLGRLPKSFIIFNIFLGQLLVNSAIVTLVIDELRVERTIGWISEGYT